MSKGNEWGFRGFKNVEREDHDEYLFDFYLYTMIRTLGAYERLAKKQLDANVKVFTCKKYDQQYLSGLIPKR